MNMNMNMNILSDIWSSITGNLRMRVKDPLIGSFVVAWLLCNWDRIEHEEIWS